MDSCWISGLSSGEGLINRVRDKEAQEDDEEADEDNVFQDPLFRMDKEGSVVDSERVLDKRLMVIEPELAQLLKVIDRQGSTLSSVIREAWDDSPLEILTKKDPIRATGSHISIIGHITIEELNRHLSETEMANGFANRFVWVLVRRSKNLPFGSGLDDFNSVPHSDRLRQAVGFGKKAGRITWGESAKPTWVEVYDELSVGKPGLFGAVTARGEAQVVRLAALYALLDLSKTIELDHLLAALAIWKYAEESARYIFGNATGDRVADRIEAALRASPAGLTRTQISNLFDRNQKAERIDQALELLLGSRRARRVYEETGGRRAEKWFAM
jgi:hypothetical protein